MYGGKRDKQILQQIYSLEVKLADMRIGVVRVMVVKYMRQTCFYMQPNVHPFLFFYK